MPATTTTDDDPMPSQLDDAQIPWSFFNTFLNLPAINPAQPATFSNGFFNQPSPQNADDARLVAALMGLSGPVAQTGITTADASQNAAPASNATAGLPLQPAALPNFAISPNLTSIQEVSSAPNASDGQTRSVDIHLDPYTQNLIETGTVDPEYPGGPENDNTFLRAMVGPDGPPAKIGTAMNFAGQALRGGTETALFRMTGQPEASNQELDYTAEQMMPSLAAKAEQLGISTPDPYEEARETLPSSERFVSGIGPVMIQSTPDMALTAVQPELGALAAGFTPQGFDPMQSLTALAAPEGGKLLGKALEKVAVESGISNPLTLGAINRLGLGTGTAAITSVPDAVKIAEIEKPGPQRDAAIQEAVTDALIAGGSGGLGERSELSPETLAILAIINQLKGEPGLPSPEIAALFPKLWQEPLVTKVGASQKNLPKPSEPTPINPTQSANAEQHATPAQDATVPPAPDFSNPKLQNFGSQNAINGDGPGMATGEGTISEYKPGLIERFEDYARRQPQGSTLYNFGQSLQETPNSLLKNSGHRR